MKKHLLNFCLLALAWLAGGSAFALDQDADGYYLIRSKEDLLEWKDISGYEATKVKLNTDIEDWSFMFAENASFTGEFDGQGHTITINMDATSKAKALFYQHSGGKIKNLIVAGTITNAIKNTSTFGVITWSSGVTIDRCVSTVDISSEQALDFSSGGFIGGPKACTITNSVWAGKLRMSNGSTVSGMVGWVGTNSSTACRITNCIVIGEVNSTSGQAVAHPNGRYTLTNVYTLNPYSQGAINGATYITSPDDVTSGKVAYDINAAAGSNIFFQTLGSDAYPVPFNTHGIVYASGRKHCDLTDYEGVTYNNTSGETIIDPHDYRDFHCTFCRIYQTDYKTPDGDGFYELGTVDDVKWFAGMVNEEHQTTIKGKLTADIDFTSVTHTPIGPNTTYKYNGIFDGQGHRIKNMIINNGASEQGFFGVIRGGTIIRNLIIDSSCSVTGTSRIGGLVGSAQVNTASPIIIENCINEATVNATATATGSASGILGAAQGGDYPAIQINNCLNTGNITGTLATAFCAWNNRGGSSMTNCVNTGTIKGADKAGDKFTWYCQLVRFEPGTLTMTNCYDLSGFDGGEAGQQGDQGSLTTSAPLTSGELCYKLNDDQSNIVWTQAIGTDGYPMPFNTSEEVKYVGDAGYTTMYDATNDWELNGDAQAYIGTINGSALHLDEIDDIPARTAVVISGTYYNKVSTTATADATGNVLKGSDGYVTGGEGIYALAIKNEKVGFYPVAASVNIPAGKAYLQYPGGNAVKGFTFVFDEDDATGISLMEDGRSQMEGGAIYNIAGQRLDNSQFTIHNSQLKRGIYIVNGKKVLK